MVSTAKTSAELLADFVYRTGYDDLPEEAIKMSRQMVLDQLGGQLACSVLDWNKKVLKYVEDLAVASDQSAIVSYGVRSAAEYAAFVNATFGHGFEIDDFSPKAIAHPGCVAVPASLSVGEREHLSGKDLLTGVALASEVITRVGESGMKWMLARGFHETCILGVFGASAAAAKMLGMDPKHIAYAMSIAGSHASGTTEFAQSGGDVKRVHADKTYSQAFPKVGPQRYKGLCRVIAELLPSKGSPHNPMTDAELEDKFMGLATRVMPEEQASKIAATVRNLEQVKDLRDLTDLLVCPSRRTPSSSDT